MKLNIEQIAFGAKNPGKLIDAYSKIGVDEWIHDEVTAEGALFGKPIKNTADLYFNYQLGYELEILRYKDGSKSWHDFRNPNNEEIFLSHQGLHVNDAEFEYWMTLMFKKRIEIAQQVITTSHTNPAIKDLKHYHYVVFNSIKNFGFDLKLIKRLEI